MVVLNLYTTDFLKQNQFMKRKSTNAKFVCADHWSKLLDKASFWIQWPNFEARIFIVKWYTKIDQNYCKSNRNVYIKTDQIIREMSFPY